MARDDRGEYRGVYSCLYDGPDFQRLSPGARLVLLTLRGTSGPCAIAVMPALKAVLAVRTGLGLASDLLDPDPRLSVPAALDELTAEGWVETEGSVAWVVRGLEFEPSFDVSNPNHRKHVQRTWSSLPSLAIRDRFRARYAQWFNGAEVSPSEAPPRVSEPPSDTTTTTPPPLPLPDHTTPLVSGAAAASAYAKRCTVAANQALEEKLTTYKPMVASAEQETTEAWRQAGVPIETAEQAIRSVVSAYRSTPRSRQPHRLAYFDGAVREAWERSTARAKGGSARKLRRITA
jgi:hypothetical protein